MTALPQTIRLALRALLRAPSFTITVIATLAVGIGLNAAIFTVVDNVLLRPLGYHNADRIVALETRFNNEDRSIARVAGGDYADLARQVSGLDSVAYYNSYPDGVQLHGASFYVPIAPVSPQFAQVLDIQPMVGRPFRPESQIGTEALVSAGFARDHFPSAEAALGQSLRWDGQLYSIVGVLAPAFSFPNRTQVWLERDAVPSNLHRTAYNDSVVARRRAGVSEAQLAGELAAFSRGLAQQIPDDANKAIHAIPLQQQLVRHITPLLHLLLGAVFVVLLIVLANLTHLLLVRGTQQLRTVTIRTALGASRAALALHAATEAVLLAVAGTALAMLLARFALAGLLRLAPPSTPRLNEIHFNLDVFLFSFLLALLVMVCAALLPVWRSWHIDPARALRADASRGTETRGSLRLRNSFVLAEVALTFSLAVASVLLTRQLIAQSHQDLGFRADALLTVDGHNILTVPVPQEYTGKDPARIAAFESAKEQFGTARYNRYRQTIESIAAVPGVSSVAAIGGAPMGFNNSDVSYAVVGRQQFKPPYTGLPDANIYPISNNFFSVMGIPLLRGRALDASDRLGAPKVVVINQALARATFPNQDPVGQRVEFGYDADPDSLGNVIVGVVGDIRSESPATPAQPTFYIALAQHPLVSADLQYMVRTPLATGAIADILRKQLEATQPGTAIKITTMEQNIGEVTQTDRFRTILFSLFAAVSILLAAIGMYGVTAYTVAQRKFEFGLRIALGATRTQLLSRVLTGALAVTLVGVALGTALALSLQKVLGSIVGQLPAFDLFAYALAACAVLLIALFATFLPARRAASADPMTVLRSE